MDWYDRISTAWVKANPDKDYSVLPPLVRAQRIGLLLDTIAGSLTVYLNDIRLGVMQASGLTGVYRWAVSMRCAGDSVRLESAPAPPLQIIWDHDTGNDGDDDDVVM